MEHREIEHKYLVVMPSEEWLLGRPGCRRIEIVQTYLTAPMGWERRVRKSTEKGTTRYTFTEKTAEAGLCRVEKERELTEQEYEQLLLERETQNPSLTKTRYAFPYAGHMMELDRYPFWQEQAVLEVELQSEQEEFFLPPEITVLRDVTDDPNLKNHALALAAAAKEEIPPEGCPCRRECPRHGHCAECRTAHETKPYAVACERKSRPRRHRKTEE